MWAPRRPNSTECVPQVVSWVNVKRIVLDFGRVWLAGRGVPPYSGGRSCLRGAIVAIRTAGWGPWPHRGGWSGAARQRSRPQAIVMGAVGEWAAQASDRTDGTVPFGLSRAKGRCLLSKKILVRVHFQALQREFCREFCRAFCGCRGAGGEPGGWGGGVGRPLPDARACVGQAAARQWHRSPLRGVQRPTFRQAGCGHYVKMVAGRNRLSNARGEGQVQNHRSMIAHLVGVVKDAANEGDCGLAGAGQ